jgi:hypothetical protein
MVYDKPPKQNRFSYATNFAIKQQGPMNGI